MTGRIPLHGAGELAETGAKSRNCWLGGGKGSVGGAPLGLGSNPWLRCFGANPPKTEYLRIHDNLSLMFKVCNIVSHSVTLRLTTARFRAGAPGGDSRDKALKR